MWTCCNTPLALPTCVEKFALYGEVHSCALYLPCLLNLSRAELRVQQVQHGRNFVFQVADACPLLDLLQCCTKCAYPGIFVGDSPSSAPRVGVRVSGTSTRGTLLPDSSRWLCWLGSRSGNNVPGTFELLSCAAKEPPPVSLDGGWEVSTGETGGVIGNGSSSGGVIL